MQAYFGYVAPLIEYIRTGQLRPLAAKVRTSNPRLSSIRCRNGAKPRSSGPANRGGAYSSVQLYICSPARFMTLAPFAPRRRQAVSRLVAVLNAPRGPIASIVVRIQDPGVLGILGGDFDRKLHIA